MSEETHFTCWETTGGIGDGNAGDRRARERVSKKETAIWTERTSSNRERLNTQHFKGPTFPWAREDHRVTEFRQTEAEKEEDGRGYSELEGI